MAASIYTTLGDTFLYACASAFAPTVRVVVVGATPSASMAKTARTRIARPPTGCPVFRKGAGNEAKLCHMGHLTTENRNGLIVNGRVSGDNGTAERVTALDMIPDIPNPGSTIGADCERGCTPHVSQTTAPISSSRLSRHSHSGGRPLAEAQAEKRTVRALSRAGAMGESW